MELPVNPSQLIDLLRAWFFAKDRSIVLAPGTFIEGMGWQLIENQELSGTIASVTLSNIPDYYRALKLSTRLRGDSAAEIINVDLRFNGDSGSNYDWQFMQVGGTTVSGNAVIAQTTIRALLGEGANSRANNFGLGEMHIPNYANTTMEKFTSTLMTTAYGNVSATADLFTRIQSGRWRSTAAINSITLFPTAGNFVSGCVFSLYGSR